MGKCGHIPDMTDPAKVIGRRLEQLRLVLDVGDKQTFAGKLGIAKNTYSPFENGSRRLSLEVALRIRAKYKVPLDYLYFGETAGMPVWLDKKLREAA